MALLILLLILIALAALGILGFIVKVAFGVALGVFLAVVGLSAYAMWRLRRAWRRAIGDQTPGLGRPRPARGIRGTSEVTVMRPEESGPSQQR